MFKHYLKGVINHIIDHSEVELKKHFSLSFKFLLLSIVWSIFFCYVYFFFSGIFSGHVSKSFDLTKFVEDIQGSENSNFSMLLGMVMIFNVSLYASFVISSINDQDLSNKKFFSLNDFTSNISKAEWIRFIKLSAFLLIILLATHKPLELLFSKLNLVDEQYSLLEQKSSPVKIAAWFDSVLIIFRTFFVYFLAIVFVVSIFEEKINWQSIKKYKHAIYASFLISLSVNMVLSYVNKIYSILLGGFFEALPYSGNFHILSFTFNGAYYAFTFTMYIWLLAVAFCIPIKIQFDEEQMLLSEIEPETNSPLQPESHSVNISDID